MTLDMSNDTRIMSRIACLKDSTAIQFDEGTPRLEKLTITSPSINSVVRQSAHFSPTRQMPPSLLHHRRMLRFSLAATRSEHASCRACFNAYPGSHQGSHGPSRGHLAIFAGRLESRRYDASQVNSAQYNFFGIDHNLAETGPSTFTSM